MSAPIAVDRRPQWWSVIGYEVSMLRGLQELGFRIIPPTKDPVRSGWLLKNNIIEGRVLHARNLCDFCTSKQNRDITPSDLFDDFNTDPKYDTLKKLTKHLTQQYGKNVPGNPRWAFNKMLAHPTKERQRLQLRSFLRARHSGSSRDHRRNGDFTRPPVSSTSRNYPDLKRRPRTLPGLSLQRA